MRAEDVATIRLASPGDLATIGRLGAEQNESAPCLFSRAGFRRTMLEMTRELRK